MMKHKEHALNSLKGMGDEVLEKSYKNRYQVLKFHQEEQVTLSIMKKKDTSNLETVKEQDH